MRIDKYLKNSRIIKRRTLASEACSKGRVLLNDKQAKPGSKVKKGDIIKIRFGDNITTLKVTEILEHVTKQDAKEMYEIL